MISVDVYQNKNLSFCFERPTIINFYKINQNRIKIDINIIYLNILLLMKISHGGNNIGSITYSYWVNNTINDGQIISNNLIKNKNIQVKVKKKL